MPLPIMISANNVNFYDYEGKLTALYTPYDVRTGSLPIADDSIVVTGIQSTAKLINSTDGSVWYPEAVNIGLDEMEITFPVGSYTGNPCELRAPAFDPAIRTKFGGWMAPISGTSS